MSGLHTNDVVASLLKIRTAAKYGTANPVFIDFRFPVREKVAGDVEQEIAELRCLRETVAGNDALDQRPTFVVYGNIGEFPLTAGVVQVQSSRQHRSYDNLNCTRKSSINMCNVTGVTLP